MSTSTALTAHSVHLFHLYSCTLIFGLCSGVWDCAKTVWIMEMWQQNSAPLLQLSGLMYGMGSFIGPLIEKPYLTGERLFKFDEQFISNSSESLTIDHTFSNLERRKKLKTAFLIIAFIQIIGLYNSL